MEEKEIGLRPNLRTEKLPVQLTETEIKEKGQALAALFEEIELAEAGKKEAADAAKERIQGLAAECRLLARAVHTGQEDRDVEVYDSKDFPAGEMQIIRVDTLDVVRRRRLSPAEMQQRLPMEGPEE